MSYTHCLSSGPQDYYEVLTHTLTASVQRWSRYVSVNTDSVRVLANQVNSILDILLSSVNQRRTRTHRSRRNAIAIHLISHGTLPPKKSIIVDSGDADPSDDMILDESSQEADGTISRKPSATNSTVNSMIFIRGTMKLTSVNPRIVLQMISQQYGDQSKKCT